MIKFTHYLLSLAPTINISIEILILKQLFFNSHTLYHHSPSTVPTSPTLYSFSKHSSLSLSFTLQIEIPKPISSSLLSLFQIPSLFMTPQQEEITKFFQELNSQEHSSISASSAFLANLSSPVRKAITMALDENHITRRPAHIHCSFEAKTLQVLKELRVDFHNIQQNELDLREEMISQGWENFFTQLHGPDYESLVKEFWRQAEHDDYYVVSHVLRRRIVITEQSIAQLLGLGHLQWKMIHVKDNDLPDEMIKFLHKELYSDFSLEKKKKEFKVKTLLPKYRAWHRIILGCLNPRHPKII